MHPRNLFPQMPNDVYEGFIGSVIRDGQPFPQCVLNHLPPDSQWRRIFFPFTLEDIQQMRWKSHQFIFGQLPIYPRSRADLIPLVTREFDKPGAMGDWDKTHSRRSLIWHKRYIEANGQIVAPITIAITPDAFVKILDGHHRLAALIYLGLSGSIPVDSWVGTSNG